MLTALLNPKGVLLYLSLMPQFIDAGGGVPIGLQLTVLGVLHVLGCGAIYGLITLAAARAGHAPTTTPKAARRMTAVSGAVLPPGRRRGDPEHTLRSLVRVIVKRKKGAPPPEPQTNHPKVCPTETHPPETRTNKPDRAPPRTEPDQTPPTKQTRRSVNTGP
ncbi:hypothetical protein [Nonomuraea sp. NPDC048916]|uniref:LysE family translocator n=1 Tax=Nonomuraea sp. NPDC048916 TaxID=3154232 RepID=UPI0033F30CA6